MSQARKQLAYDIALLWREHLKDADQAIEAYQNIPLEFGEDETEAYRALDALYEQEGRWDDLAQTLEHRIDIGPGLARRAGGAEVPVGGRVAPAPRTTRRAPWSCIAKC